MRLTVDKGRSTTQFAGQLSLLLQRGRNHLTMLVHAFAACSLAAATLAAALPVIDQVPLFEGTLHPVNRQWSASKDEAYTATFGGSHLSEWCALSKQHFLSDLKKNKAQEWIIVMGNEAGGALLVTHNSRASSVEING